MDTNDEHILPAGIGAPSNFTVRASLEENKRLNATVDNIFLNDGLIKILALINKARSRTGDVSMKVDGVITKTGEDVHCVFSHNKMSAKVRKQVTKNENGTILISGFSEQSDDKLKEMISSYRKKWLSVNVIESTVEKNPDISFKININYGIVLRELTKIVYLYMVSVFGDVVIKSEEGKNLRKSFESHSIKEFNKCGLKGLFLSETDVYHYLNNMKITGNHFLYTGALKDGRILTYISLFGVINALVESEISINTTENAKDLGRVINIDPNTKMITEIEYLSDEFNSMVVGYEDYCKKDLFSV